MKLLLVIKAKPNGYRAPTIVKMEKLIINSVAEPGKPGAWTSTSPYIGNTVTGTYEVQEKNPHPNAAGIHYFYPLGIFYDNMKGTPFMAVESFWPQKLGNKGSGRFVRINKPVETMVFEWMQTKE